MSKTGIIRPRQVPNLSELAVIVPSASLAESLCRAYIKLIEQKEGKTQYPKRFKIADAIPLVVFDKLTIVHSCLGSPCAAVACEHLFESGVGKILLYGYAGGLIAANSHLTIGSVLFPVSVIGEEFTSRIYGAGELQEFKKSSLQSELIETIELAVGQENYGVITCEGKIWSTDAPYQETAEKVRLYVREGVQAVEMELAAIYRLCEVYDCEFAAALIISDLLSDSWFSGFVQLRRSPWISKLNQVVAEFLFAKA